MLEEQEFRNMLIDFVLQIRRRGNGGVVDGPGGASIQGSNNSRGH